ncbi:MAG: cyclic nucleotide-binding domain-containing protein, partial [Actinomycetota bacterium]
MLEAVLELLGDEAGDGQAVRRSLAEGEVLIREGEKADTVYVLIEGRLSVSREVQGERVQL